MLDIIKIKLNKYRQNHLLNFYAELNEEEKKHLIQQIEAIDFALLKDLGKLINKKKVNDEFKSMPSCLTKEEYYSAGLEEIKKGNYAVVTMAGQCYPKTNSLVIIYQGFLFQIACIED